MTTVDGFALSKSYDYSIFFAPIYNIALLNQIIQTYKYLKNKLNYIHETKVPLFITHNKNPSRERGITGINQNIIYEHALTLKTIDTSEKAARSSYTILYSASDFLEFKLLSTRTTAHLNFKEEKMNDSVNDTFLRK